MSSRDPRALGRSGPDGGPAGSPQSFVQTSTRPAGVPYRVWLLIAAGVALSVTAVAPYDRRDWCLEHALTVAVVVFLVWHERRRGGFALSDTAYTLLFAFSMLHIVGAYYLYSRVPYHDWYQWLVGSPWPGAATRNHYDRLVHLCFGLMVLPAVAELVRAHMAPARGWALVISIAFVGVMSKLYELAEWGIAIVLTPEEAEAYNGQQGDMFDAQKDMALAFGGSLVAGIVMALRRRRSGTGGAVGGGDR